MEKEFNLKEYLKRRNEEGVSVRTRNSHEVIIYDTEVSGPCSILGVILGKEKEVDIQRVASRWTADGKHIYRTNGLEGEDKDALDLVLVTPESDLTPLEQAIKNVLPFNSLLDNGAIKKNIVQACKEAGLTWKVVEEDEMETKGALCCRKVSDTCTDYDVKVWLKKGDQYILLEDLKQLPGFKETY